MNPRRIVFAALVLAATILTEARAGVSVAIQPAAATVATGGTIDLFLVVTESGSAFNAFDAIVGFDPAALTPVALAPLSLQEGELLTSACANRFHDFRTAADRDSVTDVLLCSGVSVTGPGTIYRLRFQASETAQTTVVRFLPGWRFFDAGILVTPVTGSDAEVTIGGAVGAEPSSLVSPPRLRVVPNPARGAAAIRVESPPAGPQDLRVLDARGRIVRRLERGDFPGSARSVTWDGTGDDGSRLRPGAYWVELRSNGGSVRARCVLLEAGAR